MNSTMFPDGKWEEVSLTGWSSELLAQAEAAFAAFGSIGTVVVHQGGVLQATGATDQKVLIRSIRKSFLSALIGIEVQRGNVRLDATMEGLDIDDVEGLTEAEGQATVRHLLQARSGIYHPALAETKAMTAAKPPRGSQVPGSYWHYNNWDFNALGTVYEQATGRSVFDGIMTDIAGKVGMQDFEPSDGAYMRGPQSHHPAYHLHMTARDLARFGWLYLNQGRWDGVQVVPELWVYESVSAHSFDGQAGYGYMWWTTGHRGEAQNEKASKYRAHLPPFRYFAHGAFGQMIAVMPAKQVVIANLAQSIERSPEQEAKLWEAVSLVMEAVSRRHGESS
ncbi:serine hydrolase domain-containing protein [Rhizobium sp. BR 315]|uniref:serine hydrolase domain-containing protein n=1 Tax=Rhizobium sp. BR 315 TaxID=3040014 RepID=UPI003D350C5E